LGLGVWVLGFGPKPPIPNPQSPIPNPHLYRVFIIIKLKKVKLKKVKLKRNN